MQRKKLSDVDTTNIKLTNRRKINFYLIIVEGF